MRFWLDTGVDGLRLDAIPYLIEREGTNCENLPETHDVIKKIRAEIDARYPDRMLLAEANQWPEDVSAYFGQGDECHMCFHFPLMPRIYMAIAQEDRHPITDIMRQTPEIPGNSQWAIFLRNHDELTLEMVTERERDYLWSFYAADPRMRINLGIRRRLAPLLNNDRQKIELLNSLLLSMPGTPVLYYGDEIGMGDNVYLGDRDGVRTPMQWSSDRNGGFSTCDPQRLYLPPIMDPIYGYNTVNVEAQVRSPSSLLNWMKRLIAVCKQHSSFGLGTLKFLYPGNRKVLAYLREHEGEIAALHREPVARGAGRRARSLALQGSRAGGAAGPLALPADRRPALSADPAGLRLLLVRAAGVCGCAALARRAAGADAGIHHPGDARRLEQPDQRPRGARALDIGAAGLHRRSSAGSPPRTTAIARADTSARHLGRPAARRLSAADGEAGAAGAQGDANLLPAAGRFLGRGGRHTEWPLTPFTLAKARRGSKVGAVYDAFTSDHFVLALIDAMRRGTDLTGADGTHPFRATEALAAVAWVMQPEIRRIGVEQSNSSVIIGDKAVLKIFRRLSPGEHPELEIARFLTEVAHFANTPPLLGTAEHIGKGRHSGTRSPS